MPMEFKKEKNYGVHNSYTDINHYKEDEARTFRNLAKNTTLTEEYDTGTSKYSASLGRDTRSISYKNDSGVKAKVSRGKDGKKIKISYSGRF